MQAVAGPAVHSSLAAVSEYYSTTMEAAKGASSSCMLMSVAPPGIASFVRGASVGMSGTRGRVRAAEHRLLECEHL